MLGPAPICDFDGTVAVLPVDWGALRARFAVRTIEELWREPGPAWDTVREAEEAAAHRARAVSTVHRALEQARGFAILTANAESAVRIFLARVPELEAKVRAVVGRETLGGSKRDRERFARGFEVCRAATAEDRGSASLLYVGDSAWELDLARACGATALHVDELVRGDGSSA